MGQLDPARNSTQPATRLTRNPIDPFKNDPFWPVTRDPIDPTWTQHDPPVLPCLSTIGRILWLVMSFLNIINIVKATLIKGCEKRK